ncbi:MAG: efflux RND transporter periplasmic adaptor subunit [Paludibacteraceae bacterium]
MKRRYYILVSGVCALLFVSCQMREQKTYERKPVPVRVLRVDTATIEHSRMYIGTVAENANIPLSFVSGGTVTSVAVKAGQSVTAGQVLATVDNSQARSLLASAQAKLKQAEDGYRRVNQVYQSGGTTEVKLVEVRTQRDEARSLVATLQKQLTDCTLRAPQDGTIGRCDLKVGENVLPGQKIITLLGMESLNVRISVPESEMVSVHVGDRARLMVNALSDSVFCGTVTERALMPNSMTHAYEVTIALDCSASTSLLLPGMVCRVVLDAQAVKGHLLPGECIQIGRDGTTVWLVRDGRAIRTVVETGHFVRNGVLVTNGLCAGDQVVISGFQKLYNGCDVTVH